MNAQDPSRAEIIILLLFPWKNTRQTITLTVEITALEQDWPFRNLVSTSALFRWHTRCSALPEGD
jgi:hypothetical protein